VDEEVRGESLECCLTTNGCFQVHPVEEDEEDSVVASTEMLVLQTQS